MGFVHGTGPLCLNALMPVVLCWRLDEALRNLSIVGDRDRLRRLRNANKVWANTEGLMLLAVRKTDGGF